MRHEGEIHKKLDRWPESGPWPGECVSLLVYKRVDAGQGKPWDGEPVVPSVQDDGSLDRLVQVLRALAG